MECPVCRTSNISGIKYCINCGISLENSQEVNSSDIDRYGYRTEEYLSVNDSQSQYVSQDLFTSEELNSTFEEFGFAEQPETSPEEFDGQSGTNLFEEFDFGGQIENINSDNSVSFDEEPLLSEPYAEYDNNSVPLPAPPYNDMYGSPPQIIGYDQNGMPVYGQPQMYQPQIIGYDQNSMPVYGQSQMYQSQFMGYDQNGMPVYGQSQMYQSQFMGYDQNGMPVY
ncbi:MAG: hypothetical protein K2J40_04485, partial [Ruminococcus sp.]|nr:hypothetical protein [Ruminococcus sp.]